MNAILLVLRTGMQWNALAAAVAASGICSSSSAHRRFAGVGARRGVPRDLAAGPPRSRRGKDRPQSHGPSKKGAKRSVLTEGAGVPIGLAHEGANRNDHLLLEGTLDSWLNRNRGVLIRWSKKEENHLALLMLASGLIAFKKAHEAVLQAASEAA